MKDQEKPPLKKKEQVTLIEHPECKSTVKGRKAVLSKKAVKKYKVIVTYIPVTDYSNKRKPPIIDFF